MIIILIHSAFFIAYMCDEVSSAADPFTFKTVETAFNAELGLYSQGEGMWQYIA